MHNAGRVGRGRADAPRRDGDAAPCAHAKPNRRWPEGSRPGC